MMPLDAAPSPARQNRLRNALDPVSRATELLFGLIMVLTFTASLNAAEAGQVEVRVMLIGALGCNLAWGLIDAVMYLISTRGEQALSSRTVAEVRSATSPETGRAAVAATLPPVILPAMTEMDLERIRKHLASMPDQPAAPRLASADYLAAVSVFLLVFVGTLPVVLPFVFFGDPQVALPLSHAVAITLLFLTGWSLGRHWGQPWRVGLSMVALGLVLVAVALALGG
jgi:VIT1/CCC1 family predicted Fe2+/Mn2+ transporter